MSMPKFVSFVGTIVFPACLPAPFHETPEHSPELIPGADRGLLCLCPRAMTTRVELLRGRTGRKFDNENQAEMPSSRTENCGTGLNSTHLQVLQAHLLIGDVFCVKRHRSHKLFPPALNIKDSPDLAYFMFNKEAQAIVCYDCARFETGRFMI